eukprot:TRINITY_DN24567_c0_g1_i1.p1 TRINITY_DN24567_c0_g1~~TRINITY_DN24567_c0_g1_i1.p1  ORF type:complete len:297 (+),score=49.58 TRINITY_DN24567_c0_g1_i1:115-891(+)
MNVLPKGRNDTVLKEEMRWMCLKQCQTFLTVLGKADKIPPTHLDKATELQKATLLSPHTGALIEALYPSIAEWIPPNPNSSLQFLFQNAARISSEGFAPSPSDHDAIRQGLTEYQVQHNGTQFRIYDTNFDMGQHFSLLTNFSAAQCVVCAVELELDSGTGKMKPLEHVVQCWKEITSRYCYVHCAWILYFLPTEELRNAANCQLGLLEQLVEEARTKFTGTFEGRRLYTFVGIENVLHQLFIAVRDVVMTFALEGNL